MSLVNAAVCLLQNYAALIACFHQLPSKKPVSFYLGTWDEGSSVETSELFLWTAAELRVLLWICSLLLAVQVPVPQLYESQCTFLAGLLSLRQWQCTVANALAKGLVRGGSAVPCV